MPFHVSAQKDVLAQVMRQKGTYGYAADKQKQILEMQYDGEDLSMLIVLPRMSDDIRHADSWLATILCSRSGNLPLTRVLVQIPRFRIESAFDLLDAIKHLGAKDASSIRDANFSAMTGGDDLVMSAILHKAFVKVDEMGTEAAAATAVVMGTKGAKPVEQVALFRADHPFLFAIRENHTGTVLFVGRVMDPTRTGE
jgi:serpin B